MYYYSVHVLLQFTSTLMHNYAHSQYRLLHVFSVILYSIYSISSTVLDSEQLILTPGAMVNFTRNRAVLGGGIYAFSMPVVFSNYIWNRHCSIQYFVPDQEDVPTEKWQVCSLSSSEPFSGCSLNV